MLDNMTSPHINLIPVVPSNKIMPARRHVRPLISVTHAQPQTSSVEACTTVDNMDDRTGSVANNKVLSWTDVVNRKR